MSHAPVDDCPGEEDIAAFIRGCLAPESMHTLEAHVAHCSSCRLLLSALARAAAAESAQPSDSVSPTLPLGSSACDTELQFGARFGRYVVLDWLGSGGMGIVYSAYDPELNRKVALKVIRNDGAGAARLPIRDLLLQEAQAMAQLAHPNVVTVYDVGSVDDRVFIAMELVEGLTLAKWLSTERRAQREIIGAFLAAGQGLAAAHAAGLIHRDFKPDNVLIGNDGRARVTDFGLARLAPPEPVVVADHGGPGPRHGLSAPQTGLVGTLAYMAPEQYMRRAADARADQFSFAVALYEALYGDRPFVSLGLSTDNRPMDHHAVAAPRGGNVPVALRRALHRALSSEPDKRFPSMNDFLAAIAPRSRRARVLAAGAAVVVAAAVASLGGYAIHLQRSADQRIELEGRLRGLAPEMRTRLRTARMMPLHDIRPVREKVRSAMRDVERQQQTHPAHDENALIDFVLGEGHRALGDHERALAFLEAAWSAGERSPQLDAALGDVLGTMYWSRLEEIEDTLPSSQRAAQIRSIEQRYRDPAMRHLRAALAAGAGSPAYLEALITFHEHRFADASLLANAALREAPDFYEAGALEAKAHHAAGDELRDAGRNDEAKREYLAARQIFERVLQIARSDDEMWHAYGEMVHGQVATFDLKADLQQHAIDAFHTARQINPERWQSLFSEVGIHMSRAREAIIGYGDPRPHVAKMLALANEARALGADVDRVDVFVCLAQWERAVYESTRGVDPRPAFSQAVAACESAVAAKPDAGKYASLGVLYTSLSAYEAEHGGDPARYFELGDRNLRMALSIGANICHYSLGRLWGNVARYQSSHGLSPERSVDVALTELKNAMQGDATNNEALIVVGDVLVARARFQQTQRQDPRPTLTEARAALERALAAHPGLVAPIKYRLELAELEAEATLEHHADPSGVLGNMRADAQLLLLRRSHEGFAHRMSSRAELLAARWMLAHGSHGSAMNHLLARAATEAELARKADPMDALAWTASAEVESLRAAAAYARGATPDAAIASGTVFIERALKIDSRLVRTLKVRDELAQATYSTLPTRGILP